jgi:hypothetical protein
MDRPFALRVKEQVLVEPVAPALIRLQIPKEDLPRRDGLPERSCS